MKRPVCLENKTIFLCDYLSDVQLRQDIQEALNVIEQWNSVNGFIFSARGGELLSNRPEDQEMAILCLTLIQVSLALVNILLLQEVLAEEKWKQAMKQEDWRGLTPLFYQCQLRSFQANQIHLSRGSK